MDVEIQELKQTTAEIVESPVRNRTSKGSKVSVEQSPVSSSKVRTWTETMENMMEDEQVMRCKSNMSFQGNSSFMKKSRLLAASKNRSRLLDPPEEVQRKPEQGQTKSGPLAKHAEDDEDDLFLEEDLPSEYKNEMISWLVVLESVALVSIIAALICSLTVPPIKHQELWHLELWKWHVLVLVLICGRLVSSWGIRVMVFFIERNFLLRKRVLYFVYGLRRAVVNFLWLGLVLLAWHFLFDKKVKSKTKSKALENVTKVLVCFLVGTMIWLVKTLIVKVLASSFHVSTYFDRIQEALFNQFVIKMLTGPPLLTARKAEEEDENVVIEIEKMHSMRNVSAWNMKRLINMVRHGKLMTLDEQVSSHGNDSGSSINSETEAKAAAKKIFKNVALQGSKYVYLEDLMRFMPDDRATKTMSLFDGASESQRISKSSLKNWVINVFRERRALALTLNDTKTAVNKLHQMVNLIVGIIIFIIWLLILGVATGKFLLVISSQLLLVAFIFGNSCKTTFEAVIFLFVMHPFDVGDRCEIDGVQMVVEEMNILTTVFLRYDNQKIILPNSVLATKPIGNYNRSPDMGDSIEFCVHIFTPAGKIEAMKHRITSYIENKSEHWVSTPTIIFKDVEELNRLKIAVWLKHRMNHDNMGERWARRALLVEQMVKTFKELDIQYRLLPLDINIRAMPPMTTNRFPPVWTASSNSVSEIRR